MSTKEKFQQASELALELESLELPALAAPNINLSLPEGRDIVVLVRKQMAAKIDAVDTIIKGYQDIKRRLQRGDDWLCDHLKDHAFAEGETEAVGVEYVLQKRNVKAKLIIDDESVIPNSYKKQVTVTQIDKARITEDLTLGVPVPGARLEQGCALHAIINPRRGAA